MTATEDGSRRVVVGWVRYRRYRHAVWPFLGLAGVVLVQWPASLAARIALVLMAVWGVFYLGEEIVWNVQGRGRPCPVCGHRMPMRSFRVRAHCPRCLGEL